MRAADQEGFPEADLAFHAKIAAMAEHLRAAIRRLLAQERPARPG
jgi:DNA-binding FadR family transcriptional regulator